jgi:hypothetical protein
MLTVVLLLFFSSFLNASVKISYNAEYAIPAMLKLQDFIMNPEVGVFQLN